MLGIAAQQSLGNVFAGLVLLVARPFGVGNYIRVRSGALGGEFYGTVTSMSLTYVSVLTEQGMLKVPNSSLLAAAVRRPWPRPRRGENTDRLVMVGGSRRVNDEPVKGGAKVVVRHRAAGRLDQMSYVSPRSRWMVKKATTAPTRIRTPETNSASCSPDPNAS